MGQRDVPDWFSFYVYEFMSDERVVAMTLEQVGAYVLLMLGQWINGSIPSDIPALARILKRTTAEMEILWAGVGPCFTPHPTESGRLIQKRLEEERIETLARMEKARTKEKTRREKERLKREAEESAKRGGVVPGTCQTRVGNVPEPCTVLSSYTSNTSSKKEATDAKCAEFTALYPAHRLDNYGAQCFLSSTDQDGILARLRLAVKSKDWTRENGRYVPLASKWILQGTPAPATQPSPVSAPKPWKADW